ncbi:hypothetical protein BASA81_002975 [Batrachochytrium salamandrivorans]|nr:hypothetical protein BASA81_002975 [Batrachochytrium salamandrivorans]
MWLLFFLLFSFQQQVCLASSSCQLPSAVDIVWIIDGSSSVMRYPTHFSNLTLFMQNFADTTVMGENHTRFGFLEYSGKSSAMPEFDMYIASLGLNESAATNSTEYHAVVGALRAFGGTTATWKAIDYVRTEMFTSANLRPHTKRIAVLVTDGYPTDESGAEIPQVVSLTSEAVVNLREEDDVLFVFLRMGNDYPSGFLVAEANHIYQTSYETLDALLDDGFLCLDFSSRPTSSPTRQISASPSLVPTASPSLAPTQEPVVLQPTFQPTSSPTCLRPVFADIVWVLDSSASMVETISGLHNETLFIAELAGLMPMSPTQIRMAFVQYAGPSFHEPGIYDTIVDFSNFTQALATDAGLFADRVLALQPYGGSTATAEALDFVRTNVLTADTARPGSKRIVVLATDGGPTDPYGVNSDDAVLDAERAVQQLKDEHDILFVLLKPGSDYPNNWFGETIDFAYDTTFSTLMDLLDNSFLCISPTESPTTTGTPTASPTALPTTNQPTSSVPTTSPSSSPTTSPITASPTISPSVQPTASPITKQPTLLPTSSPTCQLRSLLDIYWVIDGSTSVELNEGAMGNLTSFIAQFSTTVPADTRMAFLEFAGESALSPAHEVIIDYSLIDSAMGSDMALFRNKIATLVAQGGTTATDLAINFVANTMMTPGNLRPGSKRVVILLTDGYPTAVSGYATNETTQAAITAIQQLVQSPNVVFVFIKLGEDYPVDFLTEESDHIYESTYQTLGELLNSGFLCFEMTDGPTTSPTLSPTTSPTSSPMSSGPTVSPTVSPMSSVPTTSPTGSPTSSPTCEKPAFVDIVWVLDSSGSIMDKNTAMKNVTDFIAEFATTVTLAEDRTRMGFLQYAGPTLTSTEYTTIGRNLNVTDSAATNVAEFVSVINSLVATGGTTNTAGAIDFVREYMFTAANKRPGSHRIVILLTDGNPSDINGDDTPPEPIDQANAAVASLRAEDDVIFVFIKMDDMSNYQEDFLEVETNYQYESTYATLGDLLNSPFLCFQISDAPTASPTAPTTFGPTTSPTTSPISSVPTTSPTALPSTAPTTSPISSVPTLSPTASPSSSVPTTSPTTLPTTSPASSAPTASPTSLPTRSPTCEKPAYVDIVWVLDSSSSVQGNNNAMKNVTDFIAEFSHTVTLSAEQTRMGFLQYAGPTLTSAEYTTIGRNLNVTDFAATNVAEFVNVVNSLVATGGTTNTAGAIDFVRDYMLTDANKRPGSHRIVILLTDGNPSGIDGDDAPPGPIDQANAAVASLREEDDVIFVFIKLDDMSNYKEHFLEVETNYLYESTYATLGDLLNSPFLCFQITDAPTTSPTVSPTSSAPTTSPTTSPISSLPTLSPTTSPISSVPTLSPTTSPVSSVPTLSPTTSPISSVPTTSPTTSPTSSVPTTSPTTSPTSSVPTTSPTTSPTSSVPTTSPTTSPTSSVPTTSPTTSPTSSVPTTSPTTSPTSSVPTTSPTTSPTSSVPTTSPTTSPTSSVPTSSPTSSVPTASPSTGPTALPSTAPTQSPDATRSPTASPESPSSSPSAAPTASPTCQKPAFADIVWVLDASGSILSKQNAMQNVTDFISAFTGTVTLAEDRTRMGFLLFAGPLTTDASYATVGMNLNVTDSAATNAAEFVQIVSGLAAVGGTTNTAGAIDFVREHMFTPENKRPGSHRIVILITDGNPSDADGDETTPGPIAAANAAVVSLREEDNVIFVFLRMGDNYEDQFLSAQSNFVYDSTYATLGDLLYSPFLCFEVSTAPTSSPTAPTTLSPSASPSAAPTSSQPTASPSGAPTQSPATDQPTLSPTASPSLSPTASKSPTSSPLVQPTASPTASPTTKQPSAAPTASPTCLKPAFVDIVWVLDSSSSVQSNGNAMRNVTEFITEFSRTVPLSEQQTRMGFLQFAGPLTTDASYATVGMNLNVTDPAASDIGLFAPLVSSLIAAGGTTNTAGAIDFVREHMFTPENKRPGSHRIVILITDGNPSDADGDETAPGPVAAANAAVISLREEDDVIFVFLRMGDNYNSEFLVTQPNFAYESTQSPESVPTLLPTTSPTSSAPTASPSSAPSSAPTGSPTTPTTFSPSASPSSLPTTSPTGLPTASPSYSPSTSPTASPSTPTTLAPSASPSTLAPTRYPSHILRLV